jgi:hypothetical protein
MSVRVIFLIVPHFQAALERQVIRANDTTLLLGLYGCNR